MSTPKQDAVALARAAEAKLAAIARTRRPTEAETTEALAAYAAAAKEISRSLADDLKRKLDPAQRTEVLTLLVAGWRRHCAQLIKRYSAQASNAAIFEHEAKTAKLGRMRSSISTKGGFSTFRLGEFVLVWPKGWAMATDATVWHPRNSVATVVSSDAVAVL